MGALQGRNTPQYAGRVPAGESKVPIDSGGRLKTEDQIRQVMVDVSPTGMPVSIGDLATVERVYKDPSEYARIGGEKTILLAVEMHEGNNIVDFGNTLRGNLKAMQSSLPPDVKLDLVADQPKVVSERINDFFREFGIAIVAVILITMLLLPMRVALVSAIAIPASVSMTFGLLNACGIELQQVSIAALIVVLGMVVDNAIVIVDNYVGLLDRKVPVDEAAERCATEMAVPVLTATLAIIAAFAPLVLLTGAVGEFIRALPIAVAISLGTSFFVAMLLTPLMARFFIRQGLVDHALENSGEPRKLTPLDHMQRLYNHVITWAMLNKRLVLVSSVVAFFVGLGILRIVPQLFFPLAERDQFVMDVWLPEGAKIEAHGCSRAQDRSGVEQGRADPDVYQLPGRERAALLLQREPPGPGRELCADPGEHQEREGNAQAGGTAAGGVARGGSRGQGLCEGVAAGPDHGGPGGSADCGRGHRDAANTRQPRRRDSAPHAGRNLRPHRLARGAWQVGVNVREEVANRMGLTNGAIAQQLAAGFEGAPMTTFWEGDRDVDVVLRLDPEQRQNFQNVSDTYVMSPVTGAKVPLQAVASLTSEWQPGRIVRRNGVRTLTVRAFPADHWLASEILGHARKQLDAMPLPQGYRIDYGGEYENQQEVSGELRNALLVSLVLIFLILLFQFRTLVDPLIVMAAFPLALPGAAFGLLITHNTFGFTAFIGIISVGGLVVRNSIILIDYIHERLKSGVELEEAALEAGERRLRPIFLTSAAAAVGVIPMILSGSSLWSPLASVIAFGLLGSMVFTLVAIPVLFVVAHRKSHPSRKDKNAARVGHPVLGALLLVLAFTAIAHAEARRITLDEAVVLATQQSSTAKLAHLKAKEMEARVTEARANYFPVLSNESSGAHLRNIEQMEIPMGSLGIYQIPELFPIPGKDVSLPLGHHDFLLSTTTAAQPLSQYFKIHAGVNVAKADAGIAHSDERRAENEITLKMKQLYFGLLSAERRKQAAELRIAAGEERLGEARNGVEAGAVLELKVLEGQAQIAEARHALGSLEDTISDLKVEFNDLTGLPLDAEIELVAPEPETSDATAGDLEAEALAHNPEVAAAEQTLKKARAGLSAARAEYIPEVGAFAQYVHQDGVPLLTENNFLMGLRMNWTLVEFGKRSGQVQERKAQVAEAEENLRHAESRVRVDIEKEVRKVRRAETGLEAARESVAARAEMRRITANQIEANTANPSALKEAEGQLAEAEAILFQAEAERSTARAELQRTVGQK